MLVNETDDEIINSEKEISNKDILLAMRAVKRDTTDIKTTLESMEKRITAVEEKHVLMERDIKQNAADIESLQVQVNDLRKSDSIKTSKIKELERKNVLDQLYSRRMNLLIHGEEEEGNDESKDVSLRKIDDFLGNLGLNPDHFVIVDGHRLPQKPKKNAKGPRPIAFKVSTIQMKDAIFEAVKQFNLGKEKEDKVAVSSHLPQVFQTQRKKLLGKYIQAKKDKKNAKFMIDYKYAEYYLEIEGIPHYAAD